MIEEGFGSLNKLAKQLIRQGYDENIKGTENITHKELMDFQKFADKHNFRGNEGWFLPEDKDYEKVLDLIDKTDVVLDIGAGNFALDIMLVERCKKVYAIEVNPFVVAKALQSIGYRQPRNLILVCCNGLDFPIPPDVNTLIMLLRHFSQPFKSEWENIPKIIAQIYGTWIIVPERGLVVKP